PRRWAAGWGGGGSRPPRRGPPSDRVEAEPPPRGVERFRECRFTGRVDEWTDEIRVRKRDEPTRAARDSRRGDDRQSGGDPARPVALRQREAVQPVALRERRRPGRIVERGGVGTTAYEVTPAVIVEGEALESGQRPSPILGLGG